MAKFSETITIRLENHGQILVEGLWNFLTAKYRVEDVPWGGGFLKAHQLILDVFLPPERPASGMVMPSELHGHLEALLEFMYKGVVVVQRDRLDGLLRLAKEMDFQMLLGAVQAAISDCKSLACKLAPKRPWESEIGIVDVGDSVRKRTRSQTRHWEPVVKIVGPQQTSRKARTLIRPQSVKPKTLALVRGNAVTRRKPASKRKCPECEFESSFLGVLKSHQAVVHSKEKPLNCSQCVFTTYWKGVLKHHSVVAHGKKTVDFVCGNCKREFKNRAGLVTHQRTHTKKRKRLMASLRTTTKKAGLDSLVCATCGKNSKTKAGLVEHQRTHTQERPYKCHHCDKRFNQPSSRSKHVKSDHTRCPEGFTCKTCKKALDTRAELVVHKQSHALERRYKCPHCDKCFKQASSRNEHVKRLHTQGPAGFVCETCNKGFKTRGDLLLHSRIHAPERRFLCPQCGKGFNQSSALNSHVANRHSAVKTTGHFVCETCGKRMKTRATMTQHQRTHTQDKPFKCPHCDRSFTQKFGMNAHIERAHIQGPGSFVCETCGKCSKTRAELVGHMRTHTQERPYKCPHCDKRFNQPSNRSQHVKRTHTQGPGSFPCETCDKVCTTRVGLVEHTRTHTQERPYKCPHCDKRFNQRSNRSQHVKNAHRQGAPKDTFVCETCGRSTASRESLAVHRRMHDVDQLLKCPQCAYAAITKQRLATHMEVVHGVGPSRFTCETCSKRFCSRAVLLRHHMTHTKEKPFKCGHCPYACSEKSTLKNHVDAMHGVGRFRCETCGKSLHSASLLVAHRRTHTQEKPFQCPHCTHRASRKENMNRHIDVVHGVGNSKSSCETCGESVNSARQLARHRRTHAKEKKAREKLKPSPPASECCPHCSHMSGDRATLEDHFRLVHGPGLLTCEICGERCSSREDLAEHRRSSHSSSCPIDLFRFQSMQHL